MLGMQANPLAAKPDAARRRRDRLQRFRGGEAGQATLLPVTFLGLLLVQGLHAVVAGEPVGHPTDATPEPLVDRPPEPPSTAATGGAASAIGAIPLMAAGSTLTMGGLIDAGTLIRLAGGAHFADSGFTPIATAALAACDARDAGAASAGEPLQLALGGTTELILPGTDEPTTTAPGEQLPDGVDGQLGDDGGALTGTAGADHLIGGDGADTIRGLAGDDLLEGAEGNDTVDGGDGSDRLFGGAGADVLIGGAGSDRSEGGTGDDVHRVGQYQDVVFENAGEGNDTLVFEASWGDSLKDAWPSRAADGQATFVLGRATASDFPDGLASFRQQVNVEVENVTLEGHHGHDVLGDDRSNVIIGDDAANHLFARGGDDVLHGGGGDDWLDGGAGDDWLAGGAGHDMLYGGAGDDTFVLGLAEDDTIFDHEGLNRLQLDGVDAGRLTTQVDGGSLLLRADDALVATIGDYDAAHWAGIDLDGMLRSLSDLPAQPQPKVAEADWLDGFLDPAAHSKPIPSSDPWAALITAADQRADDPWASAPMLDHASMGQGFVADEPDDPARRHHDRAAA